MFPLLNWAYQAYTSDDKGLFRYYHESNYHVHAQMAYRGNAFWLTALNALLIDNENTTTIACKNTRHGTVLIVSLPSN